MTDESSTWVDVKFKVEGELLLHLELRGYRSDEDMTVQSDELSKRCLAQEHGCHFVCPIWRGHDLSGMASDRHIL